MFRSPTPSLPAAITTALSSRLVSVKRLSFTWTSLARRGFGSATLPARYSPPVFFPPKALERRKKTPLTGGINQTRLQALFRCLGHVREEYLLNQWETLCPQIEPDNEVSFVVSIMGCLLLEGVAGEKRVNERFKEMEDANIHPALHRFLKRLCLLFWDLESLGGKPSTYKWRYAMRLTWRVASEFQARPDLCTKRSPALQDFYLTGRETQKLLASLPRSLNLKKVDNHEMSAPPPNVQSLLRKDNTPNPSPTKPPEKSETALRRRSQAPLPCQTRINRRVQRGRQKTRSAFNILEHPSVETHILRLQSDWKTDKTQTNERIS